MTHDHTNEGPPVGGESAAERRDSLVSAYLDGEATSEERATVEADRELLAEVEAFGAVAAAVAAVPAPPPPAQREAHLAAALAAFDAGVSAETDEPGAGDEQTTAAVLDLRDAAARLPTRAKRRGGLPVWLGVAAAVVFLIGGLGWATSFGALDGSTSADESASVELEGDFGADGDAVGTTVGELERDDRAADDESVEEAAEGAMLADTDTASGSDAVATESAEDAGDADDAAPPGTDQASDDERQAAIVRFGEMPGPEELASLAEGPLLRPEAARCAGVEGPGGELLGLVPVEVAGVEGEVLVYEGFGDGGREVLFVDGVCEVLG